MTKATGNGLRRAALAALLFAAGPAGAAVTVIQSPSDHRAVKYLELPNSMKVLLISDPDTDKAAASLNVAVGSASDPDNRQGLAHFLEHMLFLGTTEYPDPGEYNGFMTAHGGSHNAYTGFENTNYHLEIDKEYLEPALDRFSQFFITPSFTAAYVQREKNAVHSEYKARINDDDRRLYSVLQQVVNRDHPFSKFAVGNLDTLSDRDGKAIREELLQFYATRYSANLMTLAVLGKEPLPVLERWVTTRFTRVGNRAERRLEITAPLFKPGQLPLRLDVEPLRDERKLELYFPIPPVTAHYRVKPADYIANILGHEGQGSLLSLLKARGWAEQLAAGVGRDDRDGAALSISISLTETGLEHVEDTVGLVFQVLQLVQREGVAKWRYEEQAQLAQIAFQFDQKDSPLGTVIDIAEALDRVAPQDALSAQFLMRDYDESLIHEYLGYLRPDNMLMVVAAKGLAVRARDPWYGTPYAAIPIPAAELSAWQGHDVDSALHLPPPNPFIPEDTRLKPLEANSSSVPRRIEERPGFELWFKQDDTFKQPRADFYFSVRTPAANDSPAHAVLTSLYTQMVSEQLNEFTYAAQLAGLSYSIYPHIRGFTVRISGFNDKLGLVLTRIVDALRRPHVDARIFAREQAALIRLLDNLRHESPYEQALSEVAKLLVRPGWSPSKRIEAARGVTANEVSTFVAELLAQVQVVALAHGNLNQHDARTLGNVLYEALVERAQPTIVAPGRVVQLEAGNRYVRDPPITHPDSALVIYIQGADKSPEERVRFELLAQILEAPFYNDLRTEKQLGYVVSVGSLPLLEVPGLTFVVQSPTTSPMDLEAQIAQFLTQYQSAITAMPTDLFESHRSSLHTRLLDREQRLQSRSDRYWNELDQQHYRFDSRTRLAQALETITIKDFQAFYQRALRDSGRRQLVVRSLGTSQATAPPALPHPGQTERNIPDPDEFAAGKRFFPVTNGEQPDYTAAESATKPSKVSR